MQQTLFTPWRYRYISRLEPTVGCFLCAGAQAPDDPERLVVHMGRHHLVMLNRYPYCNGHLLLAPMAHWSHPRESPPEAQEEFWPLVLRAEAVLQKTYGPDGLNMGINLGRAAGAGVPEHYHFHLVPRWHGDTNFMTVVGTVRMIPEDLVAVWEKLRQGFAEEEA